MASLRRVAAGVSRSCRAAPLLRSTAASPPIRSADSIRSFSSAGDDKSYLRNYWDTSRSWIRANTQKYSAILKQLNEADDDLKYAIKAGQFVYFVTSFAISGVIYLVDKGVEAKVQEKCKVLETKMEEESKSRNDFQKRAVSDFQEHVSKIQREVSDLREKVLDNEEADILHRQQVLSGVHYLKLKGYVIMSNDQLESLLKKVNDLELKVAEVGSYQVNIKPEGSAVDIEASKRTRSPAKSRQSSDDCPVVTASIPAAQPEEGSDDVIMSNDQLETLLKKVNDLELKVAEVGSYQVNIEPEGSAVDIEAAKRTRSPAKSRQSSDDCPVVTASIPAAQPEEGSDDVASETGTNPSTQSQEVLDEDGRSLNTASNIPSKLSNKDEEK